MVSSCPSSGETCISAAPGERSAGLGGQLEQQIVGGRAVREQVVADGRIDDVDGVLL
jgi:hypothetical protein